MSSASSTAQDVRELFSGLSPVSLDDMNERAALQSRKDNKYVVSIDELADLLEDLGDSHEVLEIDGERLFDYESTYFDTPSLRCFHDHIRDRRPRFKTRTRCYVSTGDCYFEVKVKQEDGETVKQNADHDPDVRASLEPDARKLISDVLSEAGVNEPHDELQPSLVTAFRRATIVACDRPERTTFDFGVHLSAPDGDVARLRSDCVIAETKTPDGSGAWDRAFRGAGHEPVSLSKYRVGTGLLHAPGQDDEYAADLKRLFDVGAGAGKEIERKFRVAQLPGNLDECSSSDIRQGYLAVTEDGTEVRVRKRGDETTLTVKQGQGRVRAEEEVKLDSDEFARLWRLTEGRRLEKRRHLVPAGSGLTIELDVYAGSLDGLALAEVEFASEEQAEDFEPPDWLGEELTGNPRFNSQRLAVRGLPE